MAMSDDRHFKSKEGNNQMKFIPLRDYVSRHTQTITASRLGLTQGYISQAISAERPVYVTELKDGSAEAVELCSFGNRGDAEKLDFLHLVGRQNIVRR
jgi:hypothetical protein